MLRFHLEQLGAMVRLGWDTVRYVPRRPFERDLWLEQLYQLGVRSLTITNVRMARAIISSMIVKPVLEPVFIL